ncbi:MAG TPA: hypothetical protein VMW56_04780 [Candidatus Margulisiibacteriota bacterium]|nr:hypothetical protein [Candidatus Margulisiibacteriota bacterium]
MMNTAARFHVEDAVCVDTSDYDLEPPGMISRSPGLVLAVTEGPRLCYDVRIRLRFGGTLDLTVPAEKVGALDYPSRNTRRPGLA